MALSHYRGHDIDDIFNQMIQPFLGGSLSQRLPARGTSLRAIPTDFVEKENHFEVVADIPGMKKEDIKVRV